MVNTAPVSDKDGTSAAGPTVDDDAKYSAIGFVELMLYIEICCNGYDELDPIPESLKSVTRWLYGIGELCLVARHSF